MLRNERERERERDNGGREERGERGEERGERREEAPLDADSNSEYTQDPAACNSWGHRAWGCPYGR